jgi:hypothetical protein
MFDPPKTKEEAVKYRYNQWGGNPKGCKYDDKCCAFEVQESGRGGLFHQCCNKNGKGPSGLYCGTHAKKII